MSIWQTCLNYNIKTFFIPTEHTAICHLGFFLDPYGNSCTGPGSGEKCSKCTHGTKINHNTYDKFNNIELK